MHDNLIGETLRLSSSVVAVKKKMSRLRTCLDEIELSLSDVETKVGKVVDGVNVYKSRLQRESLRETRRLEKELKAMSSSLRPEVASGVSKVDLKVASTITIFESILLHMTDSSPDFQLMSYSILFPMVFERVILGEGDNYYLEVIPPSATEIIRRGKEHLKWIRESCETHLTEPDAWEKFQEPVCKWWKNDALPLMYGDRDPRWDDDLPFTLTEMRSWQNDLASRPVNFSSVFDAYEIYRKHKNEVYESSGVRNFDLKMFTFRSEQ